MKVLAEIVAISNELKSTSLDGTENSRIVVTFQIGADLLHATFFKRTANLERYPWSSDGLVKGAIGELSYDIVSEVKYSNIDNSPYVRYNMRNTKWTPKVMSQVHQPEQQSVQHQVSSMMAEAAEAAEAHVNPETGLPF